MMKKWLLFLILPFALYGCGYLVAAGAGAAVGAGTYAYIHGELRVEYPYPYERVWRATLEALRDCRITRLQEARDSFSGIIKGKRPTGTPVTIKVEGKGSKLTLVKIRVGLFGNREMSLMIKEAIERRLGG